jgi:hypothetical protein
VRHKPPASALCITHNSPGRLACPEKFFWAARASAKELAGFLSKLLGIAQASAGHDGLQFYPASPHARGGPDWPSGAVGLFPPLVSGAKPEGIPLGLLGGTPWVRPPESKDRHRTHKHRPIGDKESHRWFDLMDPELGVRLALLQHWDTGLLDTSVKRQPSRSPLSATTL